MDEQQAYPQLYPQQPYQPQRLPEVNSHLAWSILTLLFCCMPLGIVALIYSCSAMSKLQAGDYEGALGASASAKTCNLIALLLFLLSLLLPCLLFLGLALAATDAEL